MREGFEREYKGNIRRIEAQVEEDFVASLRASCYRERNYRESRLTADASRLPLTP